RRTLRVATLRAVARSMRVTVSSPGAARSPGAMLAAHSARLPTAMASAFAGTRRGSPAAALVAGSMPTTVPEAPSTQSFPPATVMLAAPGTAMTAANRSRAKAGTVVVGAGGGWVDGLRGLSAAPEHPAAASRTATASVLGQRGGRRGGGRRVAGVGMAQLPLR